MAAGGVLVGRGYVSIRPEFEGDWSRQARAQSSSAGRSGGSAFGAAFGKTLGAGMKAILPALGVSVSSALAPAAGAAGVLAPALIAAQSASAALKVGMVGVGDAVSAAFDTDDPEKFAEALKKLSPNARAFVKELRAAKPEIDGLRKGVQDALFKDLDDTFRRSATVTLPIFRKSLTESAGTLNLMGRQAADAAVRLGKSGALEAALGSANEGLRNLAGAPAAVVQALVQIGAAAGPSFARLTAGAGGALESVSQKLHAAFDSGAMFEFIEGGVRVLQGLGSILADVFGTLGNILRAASEGGTQALAVIGELFAELRRVTAMPEVQAALRAVFLAVSQIAGALAPVIGAVVRALAPLLAAIAPVLARIAQSLGPVLATLAKELGAALMPIITALLPVVELVADALIKVVSALTPLLRPIGDLIGRLISSLMPALEPVIGIIVQLVDALVGPLTSVVRSLAPVFGMLGSVIAQVFAALGPLIGPLVGIVTELLNVFARLAVLLVGQLLAAIRPLIPVFVQLVQMVVRLALQVLPQLLPSLNQLIGAGVRLFMAVVPLLPMLGQLAVVLLQVALRVLSVLLPPLLRLATFLVGVLAGALSTVVGWFSSVVTWVRTRLGPVFSWLNDTIIQPVFRAIGAVISWWWRNVVQRYFGLVRFALRTLGAVFRALYDKAIKPVLGYVAARFRWLYEKAVRPVMGWIRDRIGTVWRKGIKPAFDALRRAVGRVKDAFTDAKDGIGRAWDRIKSLTKKPINWVIRVVWNDGIVGLWKKIGGWIPGLPKLKKLPLLAAGGPMPVEPGVFNRPTAIVGEGNPRHPEYVIPTDPRYRRRAVALHQAAGAQLLADGGIIGKIRGAIGSAADFFTDPLKSLGKLLSPLLDKLKHVTGSPWGRLAAGLPRAAIGGLKKLVKDKAAGFLGGGGPIPGGTGVRRWTPAVRQALALVGQPLAYTATTLRRMNQESGGNPRAVNLWDINARLGHPSVGLMQVIRPTYQAYAGRLRRRGPFMYGVSIDPLANIYASMRYALSRYGSLPRAYNRAGGYDSGGWLQPGWTPVYNGLSEPEAVVTPRQLRALEGAAAAGGTEPRALQGELFLDSGEFLGVVRGVVGERDRAMLSVVRAGRR